jgi:hypothetical protein
LQFNPWGKFILTHAIWRPRRTECRQRHFHRGAHSTSIS